MMAPKQTYMATAPLITGASAGNRSTLHQTHVLSLHVNGFNKIKACMSEMIGNKAAVKPPLFARHAECLYNAVVG